MLLPVGLRLVIAVCQNPWMDVWRAGDTLELRQELGDGWGLGLWSRWRANRPDSPPLRLIIRRAWVRTKRFNVGRRGRGGNLGRFCGRGAISVITLIIPVAADGKLDHRVTRLGL